MTNQTCEAKEYCPAYMMYASQLAEGQDVERFEILPNDPNYACTAQKALGIPKNECMNTDTLNIGLPRGTILVGNLEEAILKIA